MLGSKFDGLVKRMMHLDYELKITTWKWVKDGLVLWLMSCCLNSTLITAPLPHRGTGLHGNRSLVMLSPSSKKATEKPSAATLTHLVSFLAVSVVTGVPCPLVAEHLAYASCF
jgi:hypothetical protein